MLQASQKRATSEPQNLGNIWLSLLNTQAHVHNMNTSTRTQHEHKHLSRMTMVPALICQWGRARGRSPTSSKMLNWSNELKIGVETNLDMEPGFSDFQGVGVMTSSKPSETNLIFLSNSREITHSSWVLGISVIIENCIKQSVNFWIFCISSSGGGGLATSGCYSIEKRVYWSFSSNSNRYIITKLLL